MSRLHTLQRAYPNASLEVVVIDAIEDYLRGGHVFHGMRDFDLVTLIRVRECEAINQTNCWTIAVDDYRYEAAVIAATEREWFPIVALLRIAGQMYSWLRVGSLIAALTVTVEQSTSMPRACKVQLIIRMLLVIPSHVVVYGSIFPVICYAAAHALDSNIVYEQIRMDFNALFGDFKLNLREFIMVASVSMRTVWVIALACHSVIWLMTQRSWCASSGVLGVPELFIAFVSSWTLLAQFRIPNWRDSQILQVDQVAFSQRVHDIRAQSFQNCRGAINQIVLGTTSDVQFICLGLSVVSLIYLLGRMLQHIRPFSLGPPLTIFSYTRVPYSATWLWPADALVINWKNSIVRTQEEPSAHDQVKKTTGVENRVDLPSKTTLRQEEPTKTVRTSMYRRLTVTVRPLRRYTTTSDASHDSLLEIDYRTRGNVSLIVTFNLTVMSDPLVFFRLQGCHSSRLVGLYKCSSTGRLWLLPLQSHGDASNSLLDWDKLHRVAIFQTNELSWMDLLHCG
ncbi:hypothetical protein PINS_up000717 [Pythium insidiosum]|nr:hypothetical protein PINS_up000717 [Pythium insidiosum]